MELAIPLFEKSVAIDSANPLYHYHLGLARAQTDDASRARQSLERALELDPGFSGADEARRTLSTLPGEGSL